MWRLHVKGERNVTPGERLAKSIGQDKDERLYKNGEFNFAESNVVDQLRGNLIVKESKFMAIGSIAVL